MGTITTSYTYTEGSTLDTAAHNTNIYSAESADSVGIMSTTNGGLSLDYSDADANTHTSFLLQPEHVQTEQVSSGEQEGTKERVDCFADAFAKGSSSGSNYGTADVEYWQPVPGCGLRFYQSYSASLCFWQWSVYFLPARVSVVTQTAGADEFDSLKEVAEVNLCMQIDGTIVDHTRRQTPVARVARDRDTHKGFLASAYGGRTARCWDMCHQSTLAVGWHDMQLMVNMESLSRNNISIQYAVIRNGEAMDPEATIQLIDRCTFGVRNARVLVVL